MPHFKETSLLNAPQDWWNGWGLLRTKRRQEIARLNEDLERAELFQNEQIIDEDIDKRVKKQILEPTLQSTAGVILPIVGLDIGAGLGTVVGAITDFTVYEKIAHIPLPAAAAVLVASTVTGGAAGLLESLAITPQAKAGREERLRRLQASNIETQ